MSKAADGQPVGRKCRRIRASTQAMRSLINTRRLNRFVVAGCALLLGSASAWARLPGPYEHRGTIQSIDYHAQLIVLAAPPRPKFRIGKIVKPTTFVWTENTEFIKNGRPDDGAAMFPGARVHLYYRYSKTKLSPVLLKVLWTDKNKS